MDEERLTNFAFMIKNINEDIDRCFKSKEMLNKDFSICSSYGIKCYSRDAKMAVCDTPLALIFDYKKCNPYARVIMRITKFSFTMSKRWKDIYYNMFEDAKKDVVATEKFVYLCKTEKEPAERPFELWKTQYMMKDREPVTGDAPKNTAENIQEKYTFIFWALMILTVDKTDAEEHLSLICDYAKMLDITEDEFDDIVRIVKFIYNQDKPQNFKSETIPTVFERLFLDKEVENPLKVVNIGAYPDNYLHTDQTIFRSLLPLNGMENARKNYDKAKEELKRLNYDIDWNLVPNNNLFENK